MKKSHTRTVKLKFLSDFFQKLFNQLKGKLSAMDIKRLVAINIPYFLSLLLQTGFPVCIRLVRE